MNSELTAQDPLLGAGMYYRTIRISGDELVWLRAILEAYEGLGFVYSMGDGRVYVVTTADQQQSLDSFLQELQGAAAFTPCPEGPTPGM